MSRNSYEFDQFTDNSSEAARLDYRARQEGTKFIGDLVDAGLRKNMRVLDVGSGTGYRAVAIAKYAATGEVVGIDASDDLLAHATAAKAKSKCKNVVFTPADVMSQRSLKALGQFDFIYMRLVIQHLPKPVVALKNLKGILKTGGRIFLEDTDRDWMQITPSTVPWDKLYEKIKSSQMQRGGDPNSGTKLAWYLSTAGFDDVTSTLLPVTGNNVKIGEWLKYYAPTYLNLFSEREKTAGLKVLRGIQAKCDNEPMYFFQTWFQASGRKP